MNRLSESSGLLLQRPQPRHVFAAGSCGSELQEIRRILQILNIVVDCFRYPDDALSKTSALYLCCYGRSALESAIPSNREQNIHSKLLQAVDHGVDFLGGA